MTGSASPQPPTSHPAGDSQISPPPFASNASQARGLQLENTNLLVDCSPRQYLSDPTYLSNLFQWITCTIRGSACWTCLHRCLEPGSIMPLTDAAFPATEAVRWLVAFSGIYFPISPRVQSSRRWSTVALRGMEILAHSAAAWRLASSLAAEKQNFSLFPLRSSPGTHLLFESSPCSVRLDF